MLGLVSDSAESARRPFTAAYLASSVGVARPEHRQAECRGRPILPFVLLRRLDQG